MKSNCTVCGESFSDDIRFLNHMMEKHGFRNPNVGKPDRNSQRVLALGNFVNNLELILHQIP